MHSSARRASPGDYRRHTDDALVRCAARAEPAALEVLFERHGAAALAVAVRVLHDEALAEDAVQDGFLSAWRAAGRFDPGRGSARAWLLTLVHHRAVDLVRARHALVTHEAPGPPPERAGASDHAALEAVSLRAALCRLPEEFRAPLALAYWGGLTQQECAERLQAPLGTVKSRTARALSRLHDDFVAA